MSAKPTAKTAFLAQLVDTAEAKPTPAPSRVGSRRGRVSRVGMKHIGGYFDDETVERFVLLRHRLDLDNSQLLERAIDELYAREDALAKFGR